MANLEINVITRQLPIGPATAHGLGILTEMHVIWMESPSSKHVSYP